MVVRTLRMWKSLWSLPCYNFKPALADDSVPNPLHRRNNTATMAVPTRNTYTGIDYITRVELMYKEVNSRSP